MTLAQVNQAIEDILLKGQATTVDGMSFSRANLPGLTELRSRMMAESGHSVRPLFRGMNFSGMGYGIENAQDADLVKTVAI